MTNEPQRVIKANQQLFTYFTRCGSLYGKDTDKQLWHTLIRRFAPPSPGGRRNIIRLKDFP